jgi:CheY-like chemotaxis protein
MKEVNEAAQRAESLVRQLLAFSRKQVLQPEVFDPNTLVEGTSKMLRRLIGEDIEIVNKLDPAVGKINADRGQFEQVLINLVVNARDAMPQGGKITVVTENVNLDQSYAGLRIAVKPGAYVMLAVSDTGTGMNTETQQQIFEPFFTTKEIGKGTGLGLATIYGIVKQSGGNIWVYSETGKGTTFKIYLPRVDAEALTSAHVRVHPTIAAHETILLVEDEEMVRKLACDILSARGYRVLAAKNGDDAIAICGNHSGRIDLLLTDVVMPGTGGKEVADSIKRRRQDINVLYMSGYTDDAIVHHGVLDPGMNFIEKPFTANKLVTKVQEALGKSPNNQKEASNGA